MSNRNKNKVTSTMQMDDLNLDGSPSDDVAENELLDQVSELIEKNDQLESGDQTGNPLEQVEAISKRIAELTQSLKQSESPADWHGAQERMIELDAQLAKLQNEVNKQAARGDKLESGLQLLEAFGQQVESLTAHVQKSAEQPKEDYSGNFNDISENLNLLNSELQTIQKLVKEQPDYNDTFARQSECINEVGVKLGQLYDRSGSAEQIESVSQKLDSIQESVQNNESLNGQFETMRQKLEELSVGIQKTEALDALAEKVDAIAAKVENADKLETLEQKVEALFAAVPRNEQLAELSQKLESLQHSVSDTKSLDSLGSQLNSLSESLQSNDGIDGVAKQLESLTDFVKLGALQNEEFDGSRVDSMAEQINAIGQMLVEKQGSGERGQSLEDLSAKVDSLADDRFSHLMEKFEALQQSIEVGGGEGNAGLLAEKLDSINTLLQNRPDAPITIDGEMPDYSSSIQILSEKVEQTQATVDSLANSLNSLVPMIESLQGQGVVGGGADAGDGSSSWEQQKKAMLQGYGIESDDDDDDDMPAAAAAAAPAAAAGGAADAAEVSTPELDDLKEQLEEKLRRAEIEISIERAKLHQERRDLEEQQSEIDRQQAKIETHGSKAASSEEEDEEGEGGGGRWSRFLGN